MITAATLHKEHLFATHRKLEMLSTILLDHVAQAKWRLDAWAAFSNHYHIVIGVPPDGAPVASTMKALHSDLALSINETDRATGRQVMHQYWETELTYERSILARAAYVWHNPARHGLAAEAHQYRWCSAGWQTNAHGKFGAATLRSFIPKSLRVPNDDFEPVIEPETRSLVQG
jgi:putative transposase